MGGDRFRAAVVVLLVLGVMAWLAPPGVSAAGPFSFPHRPHLSAAAIAAGGASGGSDADCRGCHDYKKGERDAHLVGCDKCHVDGRHLDVKRTGASTRPAFQHKEHLFAKDGSARKDISCFSCHAMRVDYDFIEFSVPTAGLGPKGVGTKNGGAHGEKTCADCHAAHETTGGLVTQDEKTGDGKACAVCHMKETSILPLKYARDTRPAAIKPFAHGDHGGTSADCAACHEEIKKSRTIWDYDPTSATSSQCAKCHVGKDGPLALTPSGVGEPLRNVEFSNFPHAKHLGEFSRMTCATCHFPETDEQGKKVFPGRVASGEPIGRAALVNYKACDACHGHDGWGPEKKSWHVDGHGVGAWACFKCHEGVADAAGKLAIATASVPLRATWSFGLSEHTHPGVTGRGAALVDPTQAVGGVAKPCSDCHFGTVAALPSRIGDKKFAHDPHVPATPTTANCVACHKDADLARRSDDMDWSPPANCFKCHVGMKDFGVQSDGSSRRKVPQFDHANHVRSASLVAGEKGIACVDCHVPGGPTGYSMPADVVNCTKCHAHTGDAAKVARTGPKTSKDADAATCNHCHGPLAGETNGSVRMPRIEAPTRQHLVLKPGGAQFHDKTGDCAACHARDGLDAAAYAERISSAKVLQSIHEDAAFADKPFNDPKGKCDECHRVEPRGYLKALKR